jgi:hypothetical protein
MSEISYGGFKMTGKGKDTDQDQEPPPPELSFVHFLQPNNRDLAANWAVDVGRELDNYLAQLSVTALFQDGTSSLNFAQGMLEFSLDFAFCSSGN